MFALNSIKSAIKLIPVAAKSNAMVRSWLTMAKYRSWCKQYRSPCILKPADRAEWEHKFRRETHPISPRSSRDARRRFFYVSSCWDQDRSGLIQGLQSHGEVRVLRGPGGDNQLRFSPNQPETAADRKANGIAIESELAEFARDGRVSALIGQMWNFSVPAMSLSRIRALGVPVVNIAMDDRHSFHKAPLSDGTDGGVAGIVRAISLGATAAPECISWYARFGTPAVFFPEASDASIFRRSNQPKIHDITFIGANYGFRGQIVARLRRAGLRVTTYGAGWPDGWVRTEVVPSILSQSRIILGIGGILHCKSFTALKLRDFDAAMSGSLYLAQENPDLALMFRLGSEIDTWRDIPELIAKCRAHLADENGRERIAAAGRARAVAEHTWARRFGVLLRQLETLQAGAGKQFS